MLILFSSAAYADDVNTPKPVPLEAQEQMDNYKKAIGSLEQLKSTINAQAQETESQCVKAIGAAEFCKCVAWQTPGNFIQYVAILSKTKDELNYDKLSKGDKEFVDNVRKARDKCVK